MKTLTIAALIGAQLLATAQPARAAELEPRTQQMGAFGGLRVRVPLDRHARSQPVRAGLTVAPTLTSRDLRGRSEMRLGEGLELGISGREPVRLLLAGQDVRRLGAAQEGEQDESDRDGGPSTLGWVAIAAGALLIGLVAAVAICSSDTDCIPSE